MEYILIIVLLCALGNRFRGTGVIKHFGTLKVFNKEIEIKFNGNHLYGLYLALVIGLVTMNAWLGVAVLVAYLVGEAKGWGEWVGSLTRHEPWDEEMLQRNYRDEEGKTFPFIHQIANSVCKEQIDGSFEERAKQYRKYATLALMLRGFYWWLPVYLVVAAFGVISWYVAVIAGLVLGLMFPIAAELGKRWKFERVYDLKFIKLSFSRGWENQEIVYGAIQFVCITLTILIYKVYNGI
jgi:hypothetical protein